ncbi:MAG: four helix bundle protein [Bacteroidales bacterium]|jgi:four helix bundle protein|nr:four helix bundle protein [Bacteroidales bacterium]
MFDFENLTVYQKAKTYNKEIHKFIVKSELNRTIKDQLRRASCSIMLNIAEGAGRFTNPDKRNFYVIARGSVFECVAIFDLLKETEGLSDQTHSTFYKHLEELSKMLFSMIQNLTKK